MKAHCDGGRACPRDARNQSSLSPGFRQPSTELEARAAPDSDAKMSRSRARSVARGMAWAPALAPGAISVGPPALAAGLAAAAASQALGMVASQRAAKSTRSAVQPAILAGWMTEKS